MPTFVMINEHRVVNLDMVKEIRFSEDGTCVAMECSGGEMFYIRETGYAARFWENIMNMPNETGSFGRFVGADRTYEGKVGG